MKGVRIMATAIGHTSALRNMTKVERYDWVKPGDSGKQCRVRLDALRVDHRYQRQEVSEDNTLALARSFDWVAFGSVVVMERPDGTLYLVDGQQRVLAARRRGDITDVPCIVFKSDGSEHEARAFISLNVRRNCVSAVAKFRAAVSAAINPEKQISDWLRNHGLQVTESGKSSGGVDFPAILVRSWKLDADSAMEAVLVQREVNGESPIFGSGHKGLFWLSHNGIPIREHTDKLRRHGGRVALMRAIKAYRIETQENESERVCGLAILRLINHKKRVKIPIPTE